MPAPKKDLEITIESIVLDKAVFKGRSRRLAEFRLVYPRPTLAQKTSSKTLELDGAQVLKPDFATWTGGILFKEPVQGTFGMEFSLSDRVSDKDLEGAASAAGASLLRLLGDALADAAGIKALNSFIDFPVAGLAKAVTGKAATVKTAAWGAIDVEAAAYATLKPGEAMTLTIPILAAHDVVEERRRATKTQGDRVSRKVVARADSSVGAVNVRLTAL